MKIGIIADTHANLEATEVIIEDGKRRGIDNWFCLGDILGYGPDPNEVMDKIYGIVPEKNIIPGNHELFINQIRAFLDYDGVFTYPNIGDQDFERCWNWTLGKLSQTNRARLKSLSQQELSLTRKFGRSRKKFLFTHSNPAQPGDMRAYIHNFSDANKFYFNSPLSNNTFAFVGHNHHPFLYVRRKNKQQQEIAIDFAMTSVTQKTIPLAGIESALIGVPGAGQPRDGCNLTGYAVYDLSEREISFIRLSYDIQVTQGKIREIPALADSFARRLGPGR